MNLLDLLMGSEPSYLDLVTEEAPPVVKPPIVTPPAASVPILSALQAHGFAEVAFVQAMTHHTGHSFDDVANLFVSLSANTRALVSAPQGWVCLSQMMIADSSTVIPLIPSVH